MKKIFILLILVVTACTQNLPELEADYTAVQLDFNYLNYVDYVRPKDEMTIIKSRNIIMIDCRDDNYLVDDTEVTLHQIKEEIIAQLAKNRGIGNHPVFETKQFEALGKIEYPKNYLLMIRMSPDLEFSKYQAVRREIFTAINELRNALSLDKAGKSLYELTISEDPNDAKLLSEIYKVYPLKYVESTK